MFQGCIQGGFRVACNHPPPLNKKKGNLKFFLGLCIHFFVGFTTFPTNLEVCNLHRWGFLVWATTFPTHSKVCKVHWVLHHYMHYYFMQLSWRKSVKYQISGYFFLLFGNLETPLVQSCIWCCVHKHIMDNKTAKICYDAYHFTGKW